ncbi:MAG: hypothetical protein INQ03_21230 [Candidatus Heimdallarchaeota archaeon]|nr:hypothetical protein [Candidatus Heimdallarchaeota archaeon]
MDFLDQLGNDKKLKQKPIPNTLKEMIEKDPDGPICLSLQSLLVDEGDECMYINQAIQKDTENPYLLKIITDMLSQSGKN